MPLGYRGGAQARFRVVSASHTMSRRKFKSHRSDLRSQPRLLELPPSGVSRDVVFGARHDTIWLIDCSCCPGGSNPICIPVWRAAGWFGVDPPTCAGLCRVEAPSRRSRGLRSHKGGVVERGSCRARLRPRHRSAACPVLVASRSNAPAPAGCRFGTSTIGLASGLTQGARSVRARCTPWRWAVRGDRRAKMSPGPTESGPGAGPGRIGRGT